MKKAFYSLLMIAILGINIPGFACSLGNSATSCSTRAQKSCCAQKVCKADQDRQQTPSSEKHGQDHAPTGPVGSTCGTNINLSNSISNFRLNEPAFSPVIEASIVDNLVESAYITDIFHPPAV